MLGYERQRENMVESQVRPSDVTDRRVTAAMRKIPREAFVPKEIEQLAYADTALLFSNQRGLMAARDLAKLLQLAEIEEKDRVLVIGSGYGYAAAVISQFAASVHALEPDAAAADASRSAMAANGVSNVTVVNGPLSAGLAEAAPFNAIIVDGTIDVIPEMVRQQLALNGRLVAILPDAGVTRAVLVKRLANSFSTRVTFEASAPKLPGFSPMSKAFAF